MKTFLKIMVFMFVLSVTTGCSQDEDSAPEALEATPNNVSGIWSLSEVDGKPLPEGLFCYIEFIRRERTFVMYQKFDSMYPRRLTGEFSITNDEYKGNILDGKYDYGMGNWNNSYIVTSLFKESMVLTADSEDGEICKYVRCNEVPDEILDWFDPNSI